MSNRKDEMFVEEWMRESIPLYPTEEELRPSETSDEKVECPDCGGEGAIDLVFKIEDPCRTCDGKGVVDPERDDD